MEHQLQALNKNKKNVDKAENKPLSNTMLYLLLIERNPDHQAK